MLEKKKLNSLKEKRKNIIRRLKDLNHLPNDLTTLTNDQKIIYDQIQNFDFSFWDEVKKQNNWENLAKTPEEHALNEKKKYIRGYLRKEQILPPYGEELNEQQQEIINQIESGDFSFHEQYVKNKLESSRKESVHDRQKQYLDKKRSRVKNILRKHNFLPPYGEELNEQQQEIINQIDNNDFTFYENILNEKSKNGELIDLDGITENSRPKMVLFRLRQTQILPPYGEELNEQQQEIVDDVYENWLGKPKTYFIQKYIHLSTPEGRLYYRMYHSHKKHGYNFKIDVSDIIIPKYCPLLEIELSIDPNDKDKDNYYSPDRINSAKGYVKGNVQIISLKANRMKHNATELQLLTFAINGIKLLNEIESR